MVLLTVVPISFVDVDSLDKMRFYSLHWHVSFQNWYHLPLLKPLISFSIIFNPCHLSHHQGEPQMGWLSVVFLSESLSQLDAILDATYTDAKDISKHDASGWQKYDISVLRCSFLSTYHSDYDTTKPHSHKFTYQGQYKLMDILYDNWLPLYCPLTSVITQNLSPVYFS